MYTRHSYRKQLLLWTESRSWGQQICGLSRCKKYSVLRSLRSQVSWIRKADLHVLTSGPHTFTGDLRFSSRHSQDPKLRAKGQDNWILQIKPTQLKDAGEYQCQVNTEPKISYSVFLKVRGKRVFAETHCVNLFFIVLGVISKFIL